MALRRVPGAAAALCYSERMKATIELDEALARLALAEAKRRGVTIEELAEEALRHEVDRRPGAERLVTVGGGLLPGIDLEDREQLLELMGPP